MQYSEFKTNFINNVFFPYMNNEKGRARTTLSNLYRMGINNPRGTTYQIVSALNDTKDIYETANKQLKAAGKNNEVVQLAKNYLSFCTETFGSKHPLLKNAQDDIKASIKELYPAKKSRSFTKFVLYKKIYPFLEKMKFLAKFL